MKALAGPDDESMHAYCNMVIEVAKSEVNMLASGNGPAMGIVEVSFNSPAARIAARSHLPSATYSLNIHVFHLWLADGRCCWR